MAATLLLLAGCGGGGSKGSSGGGGGGDTTTGSLQVTNSSGFTVTQLFVSPVSQPTWGSNQLGSATVSSGGTFTLKGIPVGSYDVRAVSSNGVLYWQTTAAIAGGATFAWTLSPPLYGTVQVDNHHCTSIVALYISPVGAATWGANQLSSAIPAGATATLSGVPAGRYDLKAVAAEGTYWTTSSPVTVIGSHVSTMSLYMPAGTGCLHVTNSSAYGVGDVYLPVAPNGCTSSAWGSDLMGSSTLPPGAGATWTSIPAGSYDFRAVATGGTSSWKLCAVSIYDGSTTNVTLL